MNKPTNSIFPEKLKEKSHLLYKIQQKHEHWGVAKCALLIGAGCSYPILPLGGGLIRFCQQLCYIRDVFPAEAAGIEKSFLSKPTAIYLNNYIDEKLKLNPRLTFEQYVSDKEALLLTKIRSKKAEELKKIPTSFDNPVWEDFEQQFLDDAKYGFWLDAYKSSPRERQRLIESLIENCNPSGAYIILAMLIEKGFLNNILTTNFDDFINDTLLYYTTARPRFYADDELSQYISVYSHKPNIIKLHGDYRYANIKNTNEETFKLTKSMEDKLRELLQNLDLIVIGYNGSDYSIMNVLQQVKTPDCELIWCSLDENNVHWRVANLINNTENSWFVKIKGFDDLIKDFYLELVKSPPDLIEKAKIRQEEISRYIKEYNKDLQEKADSEEEKESLEKQEKSWELYKKSVLVDKKSEKVSLLTEALNLHPNNEYFLIDRGLAFKELKDFDNAINDMNSAIKINPNLPTAYLNRGYLYEEKGEYSKAICDFDRASELGFENKAMLYNNYAVAYRRIKDFDKAIKYVENGLTLNPEFYNLYGTLALIYSDKGDDEQFYKNIEICLQKGCPIYMYLDDDKGFDRFKGEQRFIDLLNQYNQKREE
jgi:tetratricopeptide (TPR) repeat protein